MALITIEEVRAENPDDFQATVSFNHGARYQLTLHNPFTPEQEREIELLRPGTYEALDQHSFLWRIPLQSSLR